MEDNNVIPGLSPEVVETTTTNLIYDPLGTDVSQWRGQGDTSAVIEDGQPAILVTENTTGGSLYIDATRNFGSTELGLAPGDQIYFRVEVKVNETMPMRIQVSPYVGGAGSGSMAATPQSPADGWVPYDLAYTVSATPDGSYFRCLVWPAVSGLPVGQGFYIRRCLVAVVRAGTESTPIEYFDGDTAGRSIPYSSDRLSFQWDGVPHASTSTMLRRGPVEWSREWWESLPLAYRVADRDEVGGYPLLRYMQGPGSIAQKIRDLGQDYWDGIFTDPLRVPDGKPLKWLAMILGVKISGGDADLRARLVELVEDGRSPDGTKAAIADATRPYLLGSRQVQVTPDATNPNQIIVFVRADEVPSQGLAWVAAQIQRLGIAPAGHQIILKAATSTWDKWTSDVGATWAQVEVNIPTWAKSDAAGVVLE